MKNILPLENSVLNYAWGSTTALTEILGIANPDFKPMAEMWMGAHPKSPSRVLLESVWTPLDRLIARYPEEILGPAAAARFGGKLPFLFKVLAAAEPLSIQAHPDRGKAREGFRREEEEGVALSARERNYLDDNHKPECLWALRPFEGLCGFRKADDILRLIEALCPEGLSAEIDAFRRRTDAGGLKHLFSALLSLEPDRCRRVLREALVRLDRIEPETATWIGKLSAHFDPGAQRRKPEIGILSPAWLKIFKLEPGQVIFLPPGVLHAYLHGVGLEIMANSDNVVRGGLTDKHIDIPELMQILDFDEMDLGISEPRRVGPCERQFQGTADEFALSEIRIIGEEGYTSRTSRSVEILLCIEGRARITQAGTGSTIMEIARGESCLVPATAPAYRLTGKALLYKATVAGARWAQETSF